MSAFPNVRFLTSAHQAGQFPPDQGVEVAVAGRSNAGKSSAINAIAQRKGLAKTSKTPGATRLINFFEIDAGRRLVDLPGYGYAAVSGTMRQHWATMVESYFRIRTSLRGTIVVMDVRHPLTDHDQTMLALARQRGVPVHIVLTKADKLGGGAARQTLAEVRKAVDGGATVQLLSARTGAGVAEARGVVLRLLDAKPEKETPAGPADPTGASEPGVGG